MEANPLNISDPRSISSNLDRNADTWIIVPGILSPINMDGTYGQLGKTISIRLDANVIYFDWSEWSGGNYFCIVTNLVDKLSLYLKTVTDILIKTGKIPQANIKFAGHNVGGHIISIASRKMTKKIENCLSKFIFKNFILKFFEIFNFFLIIQLWMQRENTIIHHMVHIYNQLIANVQLLCKLIKAALA